MKVGELLLEKMEKRLENIQRLGERQVVNVTAQCD